MEYDYLTFKDENKKRHSGYYCQRLVNEISKRCKMPEYGGNNYVILSLCGGFTIDQIQEMANNLGQRLKIFEDELFNYSYTVKPKERY